MRARPRKLFVGATRATMKLLLVASARAAAQLRRPLDTAAPATPTARRQPRRPLHAPAPVRHATGTSPPPDAGLPPALRATPRRPRLLDQRRVLLRHLVICDTARFTCSMPSRCSSTLPRSRS
jgi:hypothetical protein